MSCMTTDVKTTYSNQTIREVCKSMYRYGIGSMVILQGTDDMTTAERHMIEDSRAIGIVTERDIVSYLGSDRALSLRTEISEVMSTPLITIATSNSLKDALETMQLRNIRRLPVMDNKNDKMVGIVTDKDILRAIMKNMPVSESAAEGLLNDQMLFGYRLMYDRFINEDRFLKGPTPGV